MSTQAVAVLAVIMGPGGVLVTWLLARQHRMEAARARDAARVSDRVAIESARIDALWARNDVLAKLHDECEAARTSDRRAAAERESALWRAIAALERALREAGLPVPDRAL